jgi:hypothetical protein
MKKLSVTACYLFSAMSLIAQQPAAAPDPVAIEVVSVKGFSSLHISGLAQVYLQQAGSEGARIEVKGMPVDDVLVFVQDSVLNVRTKGEHNGESVKVYVNCISLNTIVVAGASILKTVNTFKGDDVTVHVTDHGDATMDVDLNNLTVKLKQGGNLKVTGKTKTRSIDSIGERGSLDERELTIKTATRLKFRF